MRISDWSSYVCSSDLLDDAAMRQNDCGGVHHVCLSLLLPSRTLEVASGAVARKGRFAIARPGSYKAPCTCSSSSRPASATPCFRPALPVDIGIASRRERLGQFE